MAGACELFGLDGGWEVAEESVLLLATMGAGITMSDGSTAWFGPVALGASPEDCDGREGNVGPSHSVDFDGSSAVVPSVTGEPSVIGLGKTTGGCGLSMVGFECLIVGAEVLSAGAEDVGVSAALLGAGRCVVSVGAFFVSEGTGFAGVIGAMLGVVAMDDTGASTAAVVFSIAGFFEWPMAVFGLFGMITVATIGSGMGNSPGYTALELSGWVSAALWELSAGICSLPEVYIGSLLAAGGISLPSPGAAKASVACETPARPVIKAPNPTTVTLTLAIRGVLSSSIAEAS